MSMLDEHDKQRRYEKLLDAVDGNWSYIYEDLAPNLHEALKSAPHHVPCPVHGGKDGFRLLPDFAKTGRGICNTCGSFRGFGLLAWAKGYSFKDAVKDVSGWTEGRGMTQPIESRPPIQEIKQVDPTAARNRINAAMRESVSFKGTPVELYLAKRGLNTDLVPPTVRAHLSMPYFYGKTKTHYGKHPCLIAPITTLNNEKRTLHRIFLDIEGNKANVPDPKYMMTKAGTISHCAIKLFQAVGDVLGVGEGIETTLAAHEISAMPVWAAANATLMEQLEVPDGVSHVVIWADRDASGRGYQSAEILKKRMEEKGKRVSILIPPMELSEKYPKTVDWLDVLNEMGELGFPPEWRKRKRVKK